VCIMNVFSEAMRGASILMIEPFYTGSHKALIDTLNERLKEKVWTVTMKGKKWPWRARTAALHLAQTIVAPIPPSVNTLFASSVLNLAELCALRSDIAKLRKVLYFHENQLIYPRQQQKERDFQYGYNQILSCLVADKILFNSEFNRKSFLSSMKSFLKLMPDYRPKNLEQQIEPKTQVLYFPVKFPKERFIEKCTQGPLHILWPHRWEHDKNPEDFFRTLFALKEDNIPFKLSVLGECYDEQPDIFKEAKIKLREEIINWGFVESRERYWHILESADIVVSTSKHEFFGVAMLEAAFKNCFPLCPNALVYPEIFPNVCLYRNNDQLFSQLSAYAKDKHSIPRIDIDFEKYNCETLLSEYKKILFNHQ
ncbi:glycosyltransferase-like domain-containing protein 1-like protein, partial [Dinothrombium tinctorium]